MTETMENIIRDLVTYADDNAARLSNASAIEVLEMIVDGGWDDSTIDDDVFSIIRRHVDVASEDEMMNKAQEILTEMESQDDSWNE
jgi:flagellin-specific chaperone FliS